MLLAGVQAPRAHRQIATDTWAQSGPDGCRYPHGATAKLHLYGNRNFVSRIEGIDPEESRSLLDRLCRQADCPEHQCRFRWTPDAVAFWDNRAVQHYAASDYWPSSRVMERASIVGDQPTRGAGGLR